MAVRTSRRPSWLEWTPRVAPARFTTRSSLMGIWHASTVITETSRKSRTGALWCVGPPLSNLMSLPNPCSSLPRPRSTHRESSTTEEMELNSWTTEAPSLSLLKELPCGNGWIWGCGRSSENFNSLCGSQRHCGRSLNETLFPSFLSSEYLCTILVLLSYLLYYRTADLGDVMPPP